MRFALTFLALVALATPVGAERLTVTISWVDQDMYHAEHPTSEIYLFTEGCTEVVQKEAVVLDMQSGPPEVVQIEFYGGEVACRVIRAMADGQWEGSRTTADGHRTTTVSHPREASRRANAEGSPVVPMKHDAVRRLR